MSKQLIIDFIPFEFSRSQINESLKTPGPLIVKGILQKAGQKNHNGRIYPKHILEREVDKYIKGFVNEKRALGELDHPEAAVVSLKNVSHNIVEIHWEGDNLVGSVEVLTTPFGNILRELFNCNIKLGISSRGLGSVKPLKEDTVEVQDDFDLLAFDFVSSPSTIGAFLHPVNESISHGPHKSTGSIDPKHEKIDALLTDILSEFTPVVK